jgi:hypothetical protein
MTEPMIGECLEPIGASDNLIKTLAKCVPSQWPPVRANKQEVMVCGWACLKPGNQRFACSPVKWNVALNARLRRKADEETMPLNIYVGKPQVAGFGDAQTRLCACLNRQFELRISPFSALVDVGIVSEISEPHR